MNVTAIRGVHEQFYFSISDAYKKKNSARSDLN
jgi:hypothetical protein